MKRTLRQILNDGQTAIGLAACVMRTSEIVTIARGCGFDFLLIDTEHSPIGIQEATALCVTACEAGFPALVRVSGPESPDLARVLDCGAEGIVVPHVDTADQARHIAEKCRFQPVGKRSLPSPLVRLGFRTPPALDMMRTVEAETFVVAMIESGAGVEVAEAIAAIDGIDAVMIGANDLAADLGRIGMVDHPDVLKAFRHIAKATQDQKKVFATIGLSDKLIRSHAVDLGARLIVATNDVNLLMDAGTATALQLRQTAGQARIGGGSGLRLDSGRPTKL